MRLRTLLLGSAAAVLAAGTGAVPASAAEPIAPPGITPMATMQDYLTACADDFGVQFRNICLSLEAGATLEIAFGNEIDYGTTPGGNAVVPVDDAGLWIFEWTACMTAEAEDPNNGHIVTFEFPFGWDATGGFYDPCDVEVSLETAGGFTATFSTDGTAGDGELELEQEFSWATFTLTFEDLLAAGWYLTPELVIETAFGPVDLEIGNEFDFGAPTGIGDGLMFDPWIEVNVEIDTGGPITPVFSTRLEVNEFAAVNMLDVFALGGVLIENSIEGGAGIFVDHVDLGGRVLGFGGGAFVTLPVGPAEFTVAGAVARNMGVDDAFDDFALDFGDFRDSPYDLTPGDTQFQAYAGLALDIGENQEVEWWVNFNTVPNIVDGATLHTGIDYTLGINMWTEFTAGVEFQTDLGNGNRATQFMFGFEVALPEI